MDNGGKVQRILVIRLSALGDVVRTVPAVVSLSEAYPEAKITWVTEELGASFLRGHPALERVMVFPKSLTAVRRMAAFVKELRKEEYDIVADFHGLLKSALICRAAKAERKVGYGRTGTKERSQFAYAETVSVPEGKLCRYARNMAMAEYLGGKEPNPANLLHGPDPVRGELSSFFENLPGGGPVFAVHQGTKPRATYKRWPGERYAALADALVRKFGGRVVLTWAPEEREQVEAIAASAKEKVHLAPRTETPLELGYLLSRSDMYIGSDTGAAHIATIAGTPVLAIFGPTDPVENEPGPYSPHEMVLKDTECSPCRDMKCERRACMEAVEVEDVLAGVERLLRRSEEISFAHSRRP